MRHTRSGQKWRRCLLIAGIAGVVAAALATPAVADARPAAPPASTVPGGYASWADLYAVQDRLDRAATAVAAADKAGDGSIVVSAVDRQVRVYWPGEVPATARAAAGAADVAVSFLPARYGHAELVREASRIAGTGAVTSVAPKPDGSGLTATVTARQGRDRLAALTSVPMTVEVSATPQAMVGRQADIPKFTGGSRYNTPVGGCSNGFALRHPQGDYFVVTAAHCSNGPEYAQDVTIPGQPSPTGYSFAKLPCRDTMAIGYPGGVAARVYTGAFNSTSSVHVAGATPDFVGDLIVTSGASSGEHQGVPVQVVDEFIAVGGIPCATVGPLTRAARTGQCVVAPGDSGGPVFSYQTPSDVLGRGTMTAGFRNVSCPGVSAIGSDTVWYAPLLRPPGDPQVGSLTFGGVDILT